MKTISLEPCQEPPDDLKDRRLSVRVRESGTKKAIRIAVSRVNTEETRKRCRQTLVDCLPVEDTLGVKGNPGAMPVKHIER